jgi:DhnA family fructose-bisphosphate aldolase class Ia
VPDQRLSTLLGARLREPGAFARAAANRKTPASLFNEHGKLLIIAADHPARGALRAGDRALAMGDRLDLLDRLCVALARPGVNGVLGTPDIIEDLLLLGALDGKVVFGSMNRGGLAGSVFELDDRFTAYDAATIAAMGLQGGKMLVRIAADDPATVATLAACAQAVNELAQRRLIAMLEPFTSSRVDSRVCNELSADAMIRASAIAAGLGATSAYTWLKVPVVDEMERMLAATTLPALILGGEAGDDADAAYESWRRALRLPTVQGLVIGRRLLYPPDDDVAAAVDIAAGLLRKDPSLV